MTQVLLTLIIPPSLERTITDWLLERKDLNSFTSIQARGHGSDPQSLTLVEQVEGRKKQIIFSIQISTDDVDLIIKDLKQSFKGTKVHYWLTPILGFGELT